MLLRKSRQHFHGASNRSLQAETIHSNYPYTAVQPTQNKQQPLKKIFASTSYLKKRNINQRKPNLPLFEKDQQTASKLRATEFQLRKKYQGCRNIVKILNKWGVSQKGCLTRQELREQIQRKTGKSVEDEQIDFILEKHGNNGKQIDVHGLISLLKGNTQGVPFNSRTFSTGQILPFREKLIGDLKQNIKNYEKAEKKELTHYTINSFIAKFNSGVSKMKKIHEGTIQENKKPFYQELVGLKNFNSFERQLLGHIQKTTNFEQMRLLMIGNKNVSQFLADPILRNTRASPSKLQDKENLACETFYFSKNMQSSPNLKQTVLTSEMKRKDFDPMSYHNINQRKTRFGRSLFTKESNGWVSNSYSEAVKANQKDKIMNTLREEQEIKRMRYENKLTKLRQWRSKEMENVAQRCSAMEQRQQGRLLRIRQQQEAYNYVNFIKKKWQ